MLFSKAKVLTGVFSFFAAAALFVMPVNAQVGETAETAEVQTQETAEEGQKEEATEQTGSAAADFFESRTAADPLSAAKNTMVEDSVSSLQKDGSENKMAETNMESVTAVVGNRHLPAGKEEPRIVVAAPNGFLNIHTEASLGSKIIGKLYSNDVATVLQDDGSGWVRIQSGDLTGYVMGDYLLTDREAKLLSDIVAKDVATVDSDSTVVYYGKDKNSGILYRTESGEQLEVIGEENGWVRVKTKNGEGYLPADSTDVSKVLPTAVSTEDEARRIENSNEQEILDHEKEKAEEADRVAKEAEKKAKKAKKNGEEKPEELEAALNAAEAAKNAVDYSQEQVEAAQVAVDEHREQLGQEVVDYALQFVGNPYVWGGSSLTHGTDCSGFTMAVYAHFGVSLAHYDGAQRSVGIGIPSLAQARPGDLICYYGHVGIYIGDGKIVHAANSRLGITIGKADHQTIAAIRRIFY